MQSKEIREKARRFLSVNSYHPIVVFAMLITVFLAFFMFTIFLALIKPWLMVFGILLLLLLYIFSAPLKFSLTDYYMRSYNQNTAERFVIFEGYKKENFMRSVTLRLINTGLMLGLSILFIVPGIIYFSRSAFTYYLLKVNPGLSAWQAVKQSNRLMRKTGKKYLGFAFGFTGWFLLVAVTFGIASFIITPYFHTAKSIFFRNVLLGKEDNDPNYLNEVNTQISAILNSEIENIEKEIKMLQQQTVSVKQPVPAQKPQSQPQQGQPQQGQPPRKLFDKVAPPSSPSSGSQSGERLFMDDVGDIRGIVSGIDDVEEMVLPDIKTNSPHGYSAADFNTLDVEIMENESFDEFKQRLKNLRAGRDIARNQQKPPAQKHIITEAEKTAKEQFRTINTASDKKLFEKEKLDLEVEEDEPEKAIEPRLSKPGAAVYSKPGAAVYSKPGAAVYSKPGPAVYSKPAEFQSASVKPVEPEAKPLSVAEPAARAASPVNPAAGQTVTPVNTATGTGTAAVQSVPGGQKLSRAEILEKLKAERARRTQTQSPSEQDKKQE